MSTSRLVPAILAVSLLSVGIMGAEAGQRRGGQGGGRAAAGRAVPRTSVPRGGGSRVLGPRVVGVAPYRPYYYAYYPYGLGLSFGYSLYGYPYTYGGFYGAGYSPYAYPPFGYVAAERATATGALRIEGAPRDAQVFADGYYVGIADDFDGVLQRLTLSAGPHQIEIRTPGNPPIAVDVRIEPGDTITYHADRAR